MASQGRESLTMSNGAWVSVLRIASRRSLLSAVVLATIALRGVDGQTVTTTLNVGTQPNFVAVNPITDKIYGSNSASGGIFIIDGATNSITGVSGGIGSVPVAVAVNSNTNKIYVPDLFGYVTVIDGTTNDTTTVTVGATPVAVAVNPLTNKIYVANTSGSSGSVTVIDGTTNDTTTVTVGAEPVAVAVNPVTNKIYIANQSGNSVTVIDGATNNTATVSVDLAPVAVAVNPVTNKIYITNQSGNSVTVIDGATNNTVTVPVGLAPFAVAVNPVTNKIYIANQSGNSVTVIDGATNNTVTVPVGLGPRAVAVNPETNKIYVANASGNSGSVTVIDGATNGTTSLTVGRNPHGIVANPTTNKIYTVNFDDSTVTVIDGATNSAIAVTAGTAPSAAATNPATNKIYVTNQNDSSVTVIDGPTNTTTTVAVGSFPVAVGVNPVTNKIYVPNFNSNNVTIIDGATSNTTTVPAGMGPRAVAVNPVTNKIYVTNLNSNDVTVIDGATNNIATVNSVPGSFAVAVNPVTNKIYVANGENTNYVTVIDGETYATTTVNVGCGPSFGVAVNPATNKIYIGNNGCDGGVTVLDGATNTITTVAQNTIAVSVAVNPITNKIYTVPQSGTVVTVIDGATNSTTTVPVCATSEYCVPLGVGVNPVTNKIYVTNAGSAQDVIVIDGPTNATTRIPAGTGPTEVAGNPVAVDPTTNNVYVTNQNSNNVTVFNELPQGIPLTTTIAPIPGGVTANAMPQFAFSAASAFAPQAPAIQNVYFQIDTWQGPWIAARPNGANFTGVPDSPLYRGTHIVYAFATDGQDSNSSGTSQQLIGNISAAVFTVSAPPSSTTLTADNNPALVGQPVTFTATVTAADGAPTGAVLFFDGTTQMGAPMALSSGTATFSTATLTLGSHSISAQYLGDMNFSPSTSIILTETVFSPVALLSPASLTFTDQSVGTTSAAQTVTLTNQGTTALSIASIAVTGTDNGNFAETNNCGTSVAVGASCTIKVTFQPTGGGPRNALLTITDDAADSPQNVALSGTGMDFSLVALQDTQAVAAGQTANFYVRIDVSGAQQAVSMSCSGAPPGANCSVPGTESLKPGDTVTLNVNVSTTARGFLVPRTPRGMKLPTGWLAILSLLGLFVVFARWAKKQLPLSVQPAQAWMPPAPRTAMGLTLMMLMLSAVVLYGCGGGGNSNSGGTPAGTYTLTVTGTSNGVSHSTQLTLTVQ